MPCYNSCLNCLGNGNESNHQCISCQLEYDFINDFENNTNCYKICQYYYYFDSNYKYHCTLDNKCPDDYNKLIINKKKCVSNCSIDYLYKYEYNNTCYEKCPNNTFNSSIDKYFCEDKISENTIKIINIQSKESLIGECNIKDILNNKCKLNNSNNESMKDNIINDIKNNIINGSLNDLILNILEGDKKDLIIEDNNIIYQLTSTENQDNNENMNI